MSSTHQSSDTISIGMPVYNGERFLRKRLDSILSQTYSNFELIISDNGSTDETALICMEYEKNDKRINFFHQEKNMGPLWNFNFVLNQAKYNYFVWAAVDDLWHPEFLKKNIEILKSNNDITCSISNVESHGVDPGATKHSVTYLRIRNSIKKMMCPIAPKGIFSISGPFDDKVRSYLKNSSCTVIYGIHRTNNLRKSIITDSFIGDDWAINLNVLKYGDLHVIDEYLMSKYTQGISSIDHIGLAMQFNKGKLYKIFLWLPFTSWCLTNLGTRIFLKNIDYFITLNYNGLGSHIFRKYASFKKRIRNKK